MTIPGASVRVTCKIPFRIRVEPTGLLIFFERIKFRTKSVIIGEFWSPGGGLNPRPTALLSPAEPRQGLQSRRSAAELPRQILGWPRHERS